jgi:hypothetical protein
VSFDPKQESWHIQYCTVLIVSQGTAKTSSHAVFVFTGRDLQRLAPSAGYLPVLSSSVLTAALDSRVGDGFSSYVQYGIIKMNIEYVF